MQPLTMPPGYRFDPTDSELVGHYLYKKLDGTLMAWEDTTVSDCELYGKEEPWEIWDRFGGNRLLFTGSEHLYLFTKLKKKNNNNGSWRIDRSVGCGEGNWHREDSDHEFRAIVTIDGKNYWVTAIKKKFKYKNSKSSHHCRWVLQEYSIPDLNSELVLCCLRKNGSVKKSKKRKGNWEIVEYDENKRFKENNSELNCERGGILGGSGSDLVLAHQDNPHQMDSRQKLNDDELANFLSDFINSAENEQLQQFWLV